MQPKLAYYPAWVNCGTCGAGAGLIGPNTRTNGSKRPTVKNSGSVPGCSYHCLLSTPYPLQNGISFGQRWAFFSFARFSLSNRHDDNSQTLHHNSHRRPYG